ncbi:MAG: tRNA (adenosine(37)-N6)-threonylcarbamoyltransferase complex dimerization subunit type 1 TsaB [Clostridiales bacterium]|nr:tRNA (adenosine(37)-N6)-threonylcarbamoyltransferase complex dimerization subunit type 1 TsaB [Clostridiales bacterium]
MKNYLAVDTSGNHLCVIACKDGKISSVFLPDCAMKHSVSVMPAVDEALKGADMSLDECDFFAAVVGAGSFTGIRIGISVIKGFCLAYQKPALPVTSFDVMAYNKTNGKVLCLVDALHDCYYACGYDGEKVVYPPAYLTEEEVLALTNDGYALRGVSAMAIGEKTAVETVDPVQGLASAIEGLSAQNRFGELTALYVRKSSAELNLEEKQ